MEYLQKLFLHYKIVIEYIPQFFQKIIGVVEYFPQLLLYLSIDQPKS